MHVANIIGPWKRKIIIIIIIIIIIKTKKLIRGKLGDNTTDIYIYIYIYNKWRQDDQNPGSPYKENKTMQLCYKTLSN